MQSVGGMASKVYDALQLYGSTRSAPPKVPALATGPNNGQGGRRHSWFDIVVANSAFLSRLDDQSEGIPFSAGTIAEPTLRPYQEEAVQAVLHSGKAYGVIDMPCGSGKTHVAGSLLARLRMKAVVLVQENTSFLQWSDFLAHMGFSNIGSEDSKILGADGKVTLPDVTVAKYSTMRDVAQRMKRHARRLRNPSPATAARCAEENPHELLSLLFALPMLFIYDEFHVIVAKETIVCAPHQILSTNIGKGATGTNAVRGYGLTGSLFREDNLLQKVGDLACVLYSFVPRREVECDVIKVSTCEYADDVIRTVSARGERSKHALAALACHPNKLAALLLQLRRFGALRRRVLVFCDSPLACDQLAHLIPNSLCVHGDTPVCRRTQALQSFGASEGEIVLISSKVFAVGTDLPDETVILYLEVRDGSRRDSVQRAGRGTRGENSKLSLVFLVNQGKNEEKFAENRLRGLLDKKGVVLSRTNSTFSPSATDLVTAAQGLQLRGVLEAIQADYLATIELEKQAEERNAAHAARRAKLVGDGPLGEGESAEAVSAKKKERSMRGRMPKRGAKLLVRPKTTVRKKRSKTERASASSSATGSRSGGTAKTQKTAKTAKRKYASSAEQSAALGVAALEATSATACDRFDELEQRELEEANRSSFQRHRKAFQKERRARMGGR